MNNIDERVVWGTICSCGEECFVLQTELHPWNEHECSLEVECRKCKGVNLIDKDAAEKYYNSKISSCFAELRGTVVDYGCGGGFMTEMNLDNGDITRVYSIDIDPVCLESFSSINDSRVTFILGDYNDLKKVDSSIDELISRDVIMFIDKPVEFVEVLTGTIGKRIRLMAWYNPSLGRMTNHLTPQQWQELFSDYGWKVKVEALEWYKYGYFIDCIREEVS